MFVIAAPVCKPVLMKFLFEKKSIACEVPVATGGPGPGVAWSSMQRNYALVGAQTRGDKARECVGLRVGREKALK